MSQTAMKLEPVIRPEYVRTTLPPVKTGAVEAPLPFVQRMFAHAIVRRALVLVALAIVWEIYGRWLDNPLIFPSFTETLRALWDNIINGRIPQRLGVSMRILVIGTDLLSTLTAMFNPMPAIALLPLALLWFGLGVPSLIFVIVHSVLWAVALNAHAGFLAVSETQRMAGQTFGLRGLRFVVQILIPAAFPSILSGLKIGWAFAWRTLIAAELVFGVSAGQGGLGWFIFENRNLLETPGVFAGLMTVMIVGLFIEGVIFQTIERYTVRRWGMQR
ncbi:MAG: ABC transporter permease [Rhizobiales bacterium 32-66-11]|nr:MAG: ABC transporter permease [Rhizobiales bacterium 32-66-11]